MQVTQVSIGIAAELDAVRAVRRFALAAVDHLGVDVDEVGLALVVDELVVNAVGVAAGEVLVTLRSPRPGVLRLEVRDHGFGEPALARSEDPTDPDIGRGLAIVDSLAESWGVDSFLPGKIVWCELRCPPSRT